MLLEVADMVCDLGWIAFLALFVFLCSGLDTLTDDECLCEFW